MQIIDTGHNNQPTKNNEQQHITFNLSRYYFEIEKESNAMQQHNSGTL